MVAPPTILVIDDDPDIRADLTDAPGRPGLSRNDRAGWPVGSQARSAERPDLIICDMMMPKMSGFIVLERVKQDERKRSPSSC